MRGRFDVFFFFQAEDGIRDYKVTGVQTCALPILKNPVDAALVRPISDAVAELTQRHGGLLWGEHGKGLRSEYVPAFFGELYPSLQQLKAAFDPHNQLNPGKIATPPASKTLLLKVDGVTTRGELDRQIDERVWQSYGAAMHCNRSEEHTSELQSPCNL